MLIRDPKRRRPSPSEEGYILIWVIFLMVLLTLWLSVAIPRTTKAIQRDREVETMHRGKQYSRAVQLYFRKFHAYPPNADALVQTTEMRCASCARNTLTPPPARTTGRLFALARTRLLRQWVSSDSLLPGRLLPWLEPDLPEEAAVSAAATEAAVRQRERQRFRHRRLQHWRLQHVPGWLRRLVPVAPLSAGRAQSSA